MKFINYNNPFFPGIHQRKNGLQISKQNISGSELVRQTSIGNGDLNHAQVSKGTSADVCLGGNQYSKRYYGFSSTNSFKIAAIYVFACQDSQAIPISNGIYCKSNNRCEQFEINPDYWFGNGYYSDTCLNQCANSNADQTTTCILGNCFSPASQGSWCKDSNTCQKFSGTNWDASQVSTTCKNQCSGSNADYSTSCDTTQCQNTVGIWCQDSHTCKQFDGTNWDQTQVSTACVNQCNVQTPLTTSCTIANCQSPAVGSWCTDSHSCKQFDGTIFDSSQSSATCVSECDGSNTDYSTGCTLGDCQSPASVGSWCQDGNTCKQFDGSDWDSTQVSTTCVNECDGETPFSTSCTIGTCQNPANTGSWCRDNHTCQKFDTSTLESSQSSTTCVSECDGSNTDYSTACTIATCQSPASAGSWCTNSHTCKKFDGTDWDSTQVSTTCVSGCDGSNSDYSTDCTIGTCQSPASSGIWCKDNHTCQKFDGTNWDSTQVSTTCVNECDGETPFSTDCTIGICQSPPNAGDFCRSSNICEHFDGTDWDSTQTSSTCNNECAGFTQGTYSTCSLAQCDTCGTPEILEVPADIPQTLKEIKFGESNNGVSNRYKINSITSKYPDVSGCPITVTVTEQGTQTTLFTFSAQTNELLIHTDTIASSEYKRLKFTMTATATSTNSKTETFEVHIADCSEADYAAAAIEYPAGVDIAQYNTYPYEDYYLDPKLKLVHNGVECAVRNWITSQFNTDITEETGISEYIISTNSTTPYDTIRQKTKLQFTLKKISGEKYHMHKSITAPIQFYIIPKYYKASSETHEWIFPSNLQQSSLQKMFDWTAKQIKHYGDTFFKLAADTNNFDWDISDVVASDSQIQKPSVTITNIQLLGAYWHNHHNVGLPLANSYIITNFVWKGLSSVTCSPSTQTCQQASFIDALSTIGDRKWVLQYTLSDGSIHLQAHQTFRWKCDYTKVIKSAIDEVSFTPIDRKHNDGNWVFFSLLSNNNVYGSPQAEALQLKTNLTSYTTRCDSLYFQFYDDQALTQGTSSYTIRNYYGSTSYYSFLMTNKLKINRHSFVKVYPKYAASPIIEENTVSFKMNYRSCGYETISINQAVSAPSKQLCWSQFDPSSNTVNSTVLQNYFMPTSDNTNCPIAYYQLNQDMNGTPIDSQKSSVNKSAPVEFDIDLTNWYVYQWHSHNTSNIIWTELHKHSFKYKNYIKPLSQQQINVNYNVNTILDDKEFKMYLAAYTWGGYNYESIEINFRFEFINYNCIYGTIQSSIGNDSSKSQYLLYDVENQLSKEVTEQIDVRVLGSPKVFIFQDFWLSNLTQGYTQSNTGCVPLEYQITVQQYPNQTKYPDLRGMNKSDYQYVTVGPKAQNVGDLKTSPAIKNYTNGGYLTKPGNLDSLTLNLPTYKKYNLLLFNPNTLDVQNGTYLLNITVTQPHNSTIYKHITNLKSFTFQFNLGYCLPETMIDKSYDQIAFGNKSVIHYDINQGELIVPNLFDSIISSKPDCGNTYISKMWIDYDYQKIIGGKNSMQLMRLIKLKYMSTAYSQFYIKANTAQDAHLWTIRVVAEMSDYLSPNLKFKALQAFNLTLNATGKVFYSQNDAPYFDGELQTKFYATNTSRILDYELPPLRDIQNDTIRLYFDDMSVLKYVAYQNRSNSFVFKSHTMTLTNHVRIKFKLMDIDNPLGSNSTRYEIFINCTYCVEKVFVPKMILPPKIDYGKLLRDKINKQLANVKEAVVLARVIVKPITNEGKLVIKFTKEMIYPDSWHENFKANDDDDEDDDEGRQLKELSLFKISTESDNDNESNLEFDWRFFTLEPKELGIQIEFKTPDLVSSASQTGADYLVVDFPPALLMELVDKENGLPIDTDNLGTGDNKGIRKKLPTQLPIGVKTEQLKSNSKKANASMQGVIFLNVAVSMLVSFSLNYLWGMINCLQLIVYLPLYNILFPAKVSYFMTVLINVATFDVIPMMDELNDWMFDFEFSDDENEQSSLGWQILGFETKNFTKNSGSLLIMASSFVIWQLSLVFAKFFSPYSVTLHHYYKRNRNKESLYGIIMRFIFEGFIELFLCSLLSWDLISKIDLIYTNPSDAIGFTISFIFLIMIITLPLLVITVLGKKQNLLEDISEAQDIRYKKGDITPVKVAQKANAQFDKQWGELYGGLKLTENLPLHFYFIYIMRRYLFVMMVFYWFQLPAFQLMGNIFLSQGSIMFIGHSKMFVNPQLNQLELFNECTIMLVGYCLMGLSDWMTDAVTKAWIGDLLMYITIFNMTANLSLICYKISVEVYKRYRKSQNEIIKREIFVRIGKKYKIREQTTILKSIEQKRPLNEVKYEKRLQRRLFMMAHVRMYTLSTINEGDEDLPLYRDPISDDSESSAESHVSYKKYNYTNKTVKQAKKRINLVPKPKRNFNHMRLPIHDPKVNSKVHVKKTSFTKYIYFEKEHRGFDSTVMSQTEIECWRKLHRPKVFIETDPVAIEEEKENEKQRECDRIWAKNRAELQMYDLKLMGIPIEEQHKYVINGVYKGEYID